MWRDLVMGSGGRSGGGGKAVRGGRGPGMKCLEFPNRVRRGRSNGKQHIASFAVEAFTGQRNGEGMPVPQWKAACDHREVGHRGHIVGA